MPEKINALTTVERYVTKEVPIFPLSQDIKSIKTLVLNQPDLYRKISYVYFQDIEGKLTGSAPFQKLLSLPDTTKLSEVSTRNIKYCYLESTAELAVSIAIQNKVTDLPVVDHLGKLKGVITSASLITMIGDLYADKTYKNGGMVVGKGSLYQMLLRGQELKIFLARIPWLLFGIIGTILTATIVSPFENYIHSHISLAFFIPAIIFISDIVETQSETVFIRTLALREDVHLFKYMIKELLITIPLGIIIGSTFAFIIYLSQKDTIIAPIIGISLALNTAASSIIAIALPTIFRQLKIDPAVISGTFSSIILYIINLMIYFMVAVIILNLGGYEPLSMPIGMN